MDKLIAFFNGNQAALARALGVKPNYISMLKNKHRQMGDDLVFKAEELTGIHRSIIRPDRFGK
jgi:plasmid maintenance system antidote protein VapI